MWLLLRDFHNCQITYYPHPCLTPAQKIKHQKETNTNTFFNTKKGHLLHLICCSPLFWFLSLLKHATKNTFLLKTDKTDSKWH